MKEISEKLAAELLDMIEKAEEFSDKAYMMAKKNDVNSAKDNAMLASVSIFEARTHLQWHIDGYKHAEQKL